MTGTDILQSVQFVTVKGKRLAVLTAEDWEALVEWLETIEDIDIARNAYEQLKNAGGNRDQAGWKKWEDVQDEM
jgi:hypothetical protein